MYKKIFIAGCIMAALSVAIGAFAAHALEQMLTDKQHQTFNTAARYQMYHALGMVILGLLGLLKPTVTNLIKTAAYFFMLGIILFSGSLYVLTLIQASGNNSLNIIGAITPLGGLFFIIGWIVAAVAVAKSF